MPLYRYICGINQNKLPIPMMNILNGGRHASNNLSIQEFMIVPKVSDKFEDNLRAGAEIYHSLKNILKESGYSVGIGDEGGFAPDLKSEEEAIEYILKAIDKSGYSAGTNVFLALDVAATEMYEEARKINEEGKYYFWKNKVLKSKDEFLQYYIDLVEKYPIISIEDPFSEEDWEMFGMLTEKIGDKVKIVGDDLFVTNQERLYKGIKSKSANSILIKPNQIGTLTETLLTIKLAQENGFETIISHRSGETEDTTIADIAVATGAQKIKSGAPCRTDRVAKYNRLLYIEKRYNNNI
jgi:enolase